MNSQTIVDANSEKKNVMQCNQFLSIDYISDNPLGVPPAHKHATEGHLPWTETKGVSPQTKIPTSKDCVFQQVLVLTYPSITGETFFFGPSTQGRKSLEIRVT